MHLKEACFYRGHSRERKCCHLCSASSLRSTWGSVLGEGALTPLESRLGLCFELLYNQAICRAHCTSVPANAIAPCRTVSPFCLLCPFTLNESSVRPRAFQLPEAAFEWQRNRF